MSDSARLSFKKSLSVVRPGHMYPSQPTSEDTYDMTRKNMGIAVIFNIFSYELHYKKLSKRRGTEKDVDKLTEVLEELGFENRVFENSTTDEIRNNLKKILEENHKDHNCLLITIMSHGDRDGVIYTCDGNIFVDEIYTLILDAQNQTLHGKPKLFFIQACRGEMKDVGALIEVKHEPVTALMSRSDGCLSSRSQKYVIPVLSDILIFFSSTEGYPSFKNSSEGSWFIQSICNNLRKILESKEEIDFMTVLQRVNRDVAFSKQARTEDKYNACKQMPVIASMLTKSLVFRKSD